MHRKKKIFNGWFWRQADWRDIIFSVPFFVWLFSSKELGILLKKKKKPKTPERTLPEKKNAREKQNLCVCARVRKKERFEFEISLEFANIDPLFYNHTVWQVPWHLAVSGWCERSYVWKFMLLLVAFFVGGYQFHSVVTSPSLVVMSRCTRNMSANQCSQSYITWQFACTALFSLILTPFLIANPFLKFNDTPRF